MASYRPSSPRTSVIVLRSASSATGTGARSPYTVAEEENRTVRAPAASAASATARLRASAEPDWAALEEADDMGTPEQGGAESA